MENKGKNIDDLFKDGLGDYTETPPPAIWDRLEKKLDGAKTPKPGRYYRWLGYFAMVSLLLLLGASVARNITRKSSYSNGNVAANEQGHVNTHTKMIAARTGRDLTIAGKETPATTDEKNKPGENQESSVTGNDNAPVNESQSADNSSTHTTGSNKTRSTGARKNQNKDIAARTGKGKRSAITENEEEEQNPSIYNSTASKPAGKNISSNTGQEQPANNKNKASKSADSIAKKTMPALKASSNENNAARKKSRPYFPRFEAGVKAGYETGFNNDAAKKAVVSPYVQYNISPRFSVMLQPAIKSAYLNSWRIGTPKSYYQVNGDGKVTGPDSAIIAVNDFGSGIVDSLWLRTYTYSQSHDSIVKISSIGGTYVEFELPVLLKYRLNKKLSVYGGVNIIYSKLINVTENTYTSQPIKITKTASTVGGYNAPAPAKAPLDSVITYSGTPIANYTGPQYSSPQGSLLRFGYMLGFSYEYDKRWLFDALLQQGYVNPNVQGGYNINTALSSAYLRFTVGYKLTK